MTHIDQYDYDLPEDLIAQSPLSRRSDARLLVVNRKDQSLTHTYVRDLAEFLQAGDVLVLNDSRVVPARLVGYRLQTRGRWEGLFLGSEDHGIWRIIGRTRGKLQLGERIQLVDRTASDAAQLELVAKLEAGEWAARVIPQRPALEWLELIGRVPLPHYIRGGNMLPSDLQDYQTVYADAPGSVAAPTAGLHFTPELLEELNQVGIILRRVTLHVGLGTFRPISCERVEEHEMHAEWVSVTRDAADAVRLAHQEGRRVIAVGTTTVRALESAATEGAMVEWSGETKLFIRPPYRFCAVDGLLTNFHLPKSTLLVLVRTFGGDALIKRAYQVAIQEQYRFFSYGDAMLIL